MIVAARLLRGLFTRPAHRTSRPARSPRGLTVTASSMSGQKIEFGNGLPGYIFGTEGNPGVVCIQEWWGVTDIIKGQAQKIADAGYYVILPDLYKGKLGVDKEEASHLMDHLDFKNAVEELKQAVDYVKSKGAGKVGAIGFCMGGALALAAAEHAGVACAAPFYGLPAPQICSPQNIKVPVELHFGREDQFKGFSDVESGEAFVKKVNEAGGSAVLYVYEKCGHGFLNTGPDAVAKRAHMGFPEPPAEAQEQAWSRVFALFEKHLKA